ncbi:hypothetical protein AFM11_00090 [Mycolicibacterium wolinskyi]|uniref:Uncharacterized protein n=1 Tax=Mycolicibacterium wolinskyi TaxID=59750 RepID=A0A132PTS2_9MYCO|nr:hypothetical protein [Mycolicibacterium wolinskyi]KWX25739.1 hypothetical protein AFM11_00090 [Mycolicibacterium wolinskyi]
MDVDVTEPIPEVTTLAERVQGQLSPSRIIAGISTTVAVVAVGALIWVTGQQPDTAPPESPSPAVASGPAAHAQPVAAHPPAPQAALPAPPSTPAPAPAPSAAPAASSTGGLADLFKPPTATAPRSPSTSETSGDSQAPTISWPGFDTGFRPDASWAPSLAAANAAPSADAVIAAVSGTAGWVGGGALDVLGDIIIASSNGRQNPGVPQPTSLAALMLGPAATAGTGLPSLPPPPQVDWSKLPPPNVDLSKIPPPNVDLSKIPPPQMPQVDWSKIPPPQLPPPPQMPRIEDPFAKLPSITRAVGLPF